MLQWARHIASKDTRFHRVVSVDRGSVATRCSGRWSETDASEQMDEPPISERCEACDRVRPAVDFAFDMSEDA